MSYWPKLLIDGNEIDLSHLEPFDFQSLPRGSTTNARLQVRFNDHCFSRTFEMATDNIAHLLPVAFCGKFEKRVFCTDRYRLSRHLPRFIKALGNKRIASTREGNLVRIEIPDGRQYAIFFTLRRIAAQEASLFVVSAYPLERGKRPADTGEMKFDIALAKILRSEKAKFPHR